MTPEPVEVPADDGLDLGWLFGQDDGLGPFVVEVGDASPLGEVAEIKATANPDAADLKFPH